MFSEMDYRSSKSFIINTSVFISDNYLFPSRPTYQISLFLASVSNALKSSFLTSLPTGDESSFRRCKNALAEFLVASDLDLSFDFVFDSPFRTLHKYGLKKLKCVLRIGLYI